MKKSFLVGCHKRAWKEGGFVLVGWVSLPCSPFPFLQVCFKTVPSSSCIPAPSLPKSIMLKCAVDFSCKDCLAVWSKKKKSSSMFTGVRLASHFLCDTARNVGNVWCEILQQNWDLPLNRAAPKAGDGSALPAASTRLSPLWLLPWCLVLPFQPLQGRGDPSGRKGSPLAT